MAGANQSAPRPAERGRRVALIDSYSGTAELAVPPHARDWMRHPSALPPNRGQSVKLLGRDAGLQLTEDRVDPGVRAAACSCAHSGRGWIRRCQMATREAVGVRKA